MHTHFLRKIKPEVETAGMRQWKRETREEELRWLTADSGCGTEQVKGGYRKMKTRPALCPHQGVRFS